jgi:hypothetical protein
MTTEIFRLLKGVWAFAIFIFFIFFPRLSFIAISCPSPMSSWVTKKIQSPLDNGAVPDGNQKNSVAI